MTRTKIRPEAPVVQRVARQVLRGLYALTPDTSDTRELQQRVGDRWRYRTSGYGNGNADNGNQ